MEKRWRFKNNNIDAEQVHSLKAYANISYETAAILVSRGITVNNYGDFTHESIKNLLDPFLLCDMQKATERINQAIEKGEHITVYGDYDVDGISATVLLMRYFGSKNIDCDYYIPDRESEGYGINRDALDIIKDRGSSLVITVDTGITACEEVRYAKEHGIDIIVTDHHEPKDEIPDAVAVVDPKRKESEYPFKELSGTGVAFKLICALEGEAKQLVIDYSDIVAVATVADVVSLTGENRILTALGIRKLRKMPAVAYEAIMESIGVKKHEISSYHIGFAIAPRINAAGRMGTAEKAVELLLTDNIDDARRKAEELNDINTQRKETGQHILSEAIDEIESNRLYDDKVIVLAHHNWHHGIIGITASRLAEMYERTVILISLDPEDGKGSGRAAAGLNLFDALTSVSHLLLKFGGHASAAGLTVAKENIDELRAQLNKYAEEHLCEEDMIPIVDIDIELSCKKPLMQLAEEMLVLEPFGSGNEKPVFALMNVEVTGIRTDRSERHLMMKVKKENTYIDCVGFGMGELREHIKVGDHIDIAATLNKNVYGNSITAQFHIADIKEAQCSTHTKN